MKKEYLFGLIGIFIGWVLAMLFLQNSAFSNKMVNSRIQKEEGTKNSVDAHFIEQMIPHHEDAIKMSELASDYAKRDEIKTLALNIIESQSREIEQMEEWYEKWFDREVAIDGSIMSQHGMMSSSGFHMGRMGDETDIEKLMDASDFDKEFIEEMIPHHQMAVMMASMLKRGSERPEMQKLADDIISAQTSEIEQMRQWYKDWGY